MSKDPRNAPAPSGWRSNRGGVFFTKETVVGVRYRCKGCHHEQLGLPTRETFHRDDCPFAPPPAPAPPPDRVLVVEHTPVTFVVAVDGEAWARVPVWHDDAGRPQTAEAKRRADLIAAGLRKVLP